MNSFGRTDQSLKYLRLLSQQFPTQQSVFTEIINLQAILNLPKGTEHFMSDLHGEYEAFLHILNNCSGVVREHVDDIFGDTLSEERRLTSARSFTIRTRSSSLRIACTSIRRAGTRPPSTACWW